jgi:hypothetical protein
VNLLSSLSTAAVQGGHSGTGWTINQLWTAAVGIGGGFHRHDIDDIVSGRRAATSAEHDILATAMNEYFSDHGQDHPVALWGSLLSTH